MTATPRIKGRYSSSFKAVEHGEQAAVLEREMILDGTEPLLMEQSLCQNEKRLWEKADKESIGGLYVSSIHPPTSITHCVRGKFVKSSHEYFAIAKSNLLQVHDATEDGLVHYCERNFVSPISVLLVIPQFGDMTCDYLFLVTQRLHYFIVRVKDRKVELLTSGSLASRLGKAAEMGIAAAYDVVNHVVAVHFYEGLIQVIPISEQVSRGSPLHVLPMRIDERVCLSCCFVSSVHRPCLAILYEDGQQIRHLRSYYLNLKKKEAIPGKLAVPFAETGANLLVPLHKPNSSVLILGESTITHLKVGDENEKPVVLDIARPTSFKAFSVVHAQASVLLSDYLGKLYLLKIADARLEIAELGETVAAACVCWLDNGFVFVGSHYGDSQLVRIVADGGEPCIEEAVSYPNLAPILDFVCIENPAYGQTQLVTCSNAFKDGSLRLVQNELGVKELSSGDISNVENIWSFQLDGKLGIALSFFEETRCLQGTSGETLIEWADCPLVDESNPTVLVHQCGSGIVLQITKTSAILHGCSEAAKATWKTPCEVSVLGASAAGEYAVVSLSDKSVIQLRFSGSSGFAPSERLEIDREVSCMHLERVDTELQLLAGCWGEAGFRIYRRSEGHWTLSAKESFSEYVGDATARSVLAAYLEGNRFLFVGLGDGRLLVYAGEGPLKLLRSLHAGTQPLRLFELSLPSGNRVFVASDRSSVVSLRHGLLHSNPVDISFCCSARTLFPKVYRALPGKEWHAGLVLFQTQSQLILGSINETQDVNVRTVALAENEFARRICYQPASSLLLVGTVRLCKSDNRNEEGKEQSFLKAYLRDRLETGEVASTYGLEQLETVESLVSLDCTTEGAEVNVFAVGTSLYENRGRDGEATGRLLLFTTTEDGQLHACLGRHLPGPVYALSNLNGRLVVSTGSQVQVYSLQWTKESSETLLCELLLIASYSSQVLGAALATSPSNLIAVGDMVRSITLLQLQDTADGGFRLRVVGRDSNSNWTTAVEFINSKNVIGAEHLGNIFSLCLNLPSGSSGDDDQLADEVPHCLTTRGVLHLGGQVNQFRRGTLSLASSNLPGGEMLANPKILFATIYGMIGSVSTLVPQRFYYVYVLYLGMCRFLETQGDIKHLQVRQFANERRTEDVKGFIDGDLVESLLSWPRAKLDSLVLFLNDNRLELLKLVPELSMDAHGVVLNGRSDPSAVKSGQSKGKSTVHAMLSYTSSISNKVLKFNLLQPFVLENLLLIVQELSCMR